ELLQGCRLCLRLMAGGFKTLVPNQVIELCRSLDASVPQGSNFHVIRKREGENYQTQTCHSIAKRSGLHWHLHQVIGKISLAK
ncbi:hypothetical protein, partial [Ruegeria sp. HKCCD8929]|uniref:hypothetical protein n=1 Tax=Ruegeria sp. HKCCD8929 TaxID=2683006 RepID=UPI001C2C6A5B